MDSNDFGRSPDGSGYSAEPEPSCTVSAVPVSIPNAVFTPGPWSIEVEAEPDGDTPEVYVCHPGTVCTATVVCTMGWSAKRPHQQRLADARLITVAPEMLAALAECHEVMHKCTAVLSASDCAEVAATMARVRAILTKARG